MILFHISGRPAQEKELWKEDLCYLCWKYSKRNHSRWIRRTFFKIWHSFRCWFSNELNYCSPKNICIYPLLEWKRKRCCFNCSHAHGWLMITNVIFQNGNIQLNMYFFLCITWLHIHFSLCSWMILNWRFNNVHQK